MNKYKPEYLGKVIPAEDPLKMTDMLQNKFEQFSSIYDTCKDMSTNISDIKVVDTSPDLLSVKISISPFDTVPSVLLVECKK